MGLIGLLIIPNKEIKHKKELFLWMLAMFLIANVFSFSGTLWDMAKFFAYMMVPVAVLCAGLLVQLFKKSVYQVGYNKFPAFILPSLI